MSAARSALAVLVAAALAVGLAAAQEARPVIGILTHPEENVTRGHSYIPASYVKWLESGGARVVPIYYDQPEASLRTLLESLNGALFTGGEAAFVEKDGVTLSQYAETARIIYETAVVRHAEDENWPLWGTCLGHELISFLAAGGTNAVLASGFDSSSHPTNLSWTAGAVSSAIWGKADIRDAFASAPIAFQNHVQGVEQDAFDKYLSVDFTATSIAYDRKGRPYISSMEGQAGLPVFSVQFHPEKALFEWPLSSLEPIPHSLNAVLANHWASPIFVEQASRNARAFPGFDALRDALIYNYVPRYNKAQSAEFMETYFFPPAKA